MSQLADAAVAKFSEGYNCSQAVLFACRERLGMEADVALKVATGFGAGMGRCQEVCGAFSGGVLALGFRYGRAEGEPLSKTEQSYAKVQELTAVFVQKHGTTICRELLSGCDLRTEAGQKRFKDEGMKNAKCIPCVRTVADAMERML